MSGNRRSKNCGAWWWRRSAGMMLRSGCSVPAPAASRASTATSTLRSYRATSFPGFFGNLQADIEESPIPYDVDLVDLGHADPALIAEVRREGVKWRD